MVNAAQHHDTGAGHDRDTDQSHDLLRDWCTAIDTLYPLEDAEGWDQVGLHIGDPDNDHVAGVLVSLDVTSAVLIEAQQLGANLLIAHHPLLFSPLSRLTPETASGRLALTAARQGCAVLAAHTNVDKAVDGTSHPAARVLGLTDLRPIIPTTRDALDGHAPDDEAPTGTVGPKGLGLIGSLPEPLSLTAVARLLAAGLGTPHLRLAAPDPTLRVQTVAICGGAGDSLIPAVLGGTDADVFVTGDLKHHVVLDALTLGLPLIDAGHFATENPAMDAVFARLTEIRRDSGLRAPLHRSSISTDPWTDWTPRI